MEMTYQRTIEKAVAIGGIGLHTGEKVSMLVKPSPADSGINFIRTDLPNRPLINIRSMALGGGPAASRRTTVASGAIVIETVEHLMAAIAVLGIDNVVIEVDNTELPGLDGSAKGFFDALKAAGVTEQGSPRRVLKIDQPAWVEAEDSFLAIFPSEEYRISYTLSYTNPRALEGFYSVRVDEATFGREIAPARTFCFEEEALVLLKSGYGKGANYENTLVIGANGPIKNAYRFPDEPVRHKVLDLIGDLALVGYVVRGHVIGIRSGHDMNRELVRKLRGRID